MKGEYYYYQQVRLSEQNLDAKDIRCNVMWSMHAKAVLKSPKVFRVSKNETPWNLDEDKPTRYEYNTAKLTCTKSWNKACELLPFQA